jgi:hypothetical protein
MHTSGRKVVVKALRLASSEDGAVMVEFLIVAPVLLFLITGTIQMMGISHAHALLQYGNFMAARTGIVHYERLAHGWNTEDGNEPSEAELKGEMTELMRGAVEKGLGPLHRETTVGSLIVGGSDLFGVSIPTDVKQFLSPPWISPVVIEQPPLPFSLLRRNVRLDWGVINVHEDSPRVPQWLYVQTEVDVGMGFPFASSVIEGVHKGLSTKSEQRAVATGFDALTGEDPNLFGEAVLFFTHPDVYGYPYIVMRSNSALDLRSNSRKETFFGLLSSLEENWEPWPLTERDDSSVTISESEFLFPAIPFFEKETAQPAVLPIQLRFWEEDLTR